MRGLWTAAREKTSVHDIILVSHSGKNSQKLYHTDTIISPGEPLPDSPTRTHTLPEICQEQGLQPGSSFGSATDNLEASTPNHLHAHHHPKRVPRRKKRSRAPHPPDLPLHGTITTGEDWPDHYSGRYVCAVREAACLQGFPPEYTFGCYQETSGQCGTTTRCQSHPGRGQEVADENACFEEVLRSE